MRTLKSGRVCDRNSRLTSIVALIFSVFLVNIGLQIPAHAQAVPKSLEEGGPEGALRNKKNQWTIGVAGGLLSGTNLLFADELAQVLDDGDNLRIIPMITYGAAQNLDDLLYLRGVDVAITQSDVFEYFRTQRKRPIWNNVFTTSFACRSQRCTFWHARTSAASRTCAARRSTSAQQAAHQA